MKTLMKDLRESNEFLNILLDNINSAVLVVDENLHINHVNDFFLSLFGRGELPGREYTFGQAAGCAFAVTEKGGCGQTTNCVRCILRNTFLESLTRKVPADKVSLSRVFFIDGIPRTKYLQFTTRFVEFETHPMVLVIIYDVTELTLQRLQLADKQKQIDRDLRDAALIQKSLLPGPEPKSTRLHMAWEFLPCRQIGGDIFNVMRSPDNLTALYMVDVCGHGVSAALIAVTVSQHLQNLSCSHCGGALPLPPAAVLNDLEDHFPFERFDTFFTCVYVLIDEKTGQLTCASAGHPPALIARANGTVERIPTRGPVIGPGRGSRFEQAESQLVGGDQVVLYTDGVTEAQGTGGTLFGSERIVEVLRTSRQETPGGLSASLFHAVRAFSRSSEPEDDISILVARYAPSPPSHDGD